jgi:hypothetical protein
MQLHPISLHVVGGVRPRAQHAGFSRERNSPAAASSILISTLTLAYINKASLHTREEKKKERRERRQTAAIPCQAYTQGGS